MKNYFSLFILICSELGASFTTLFTVFKELTFGNKSKRSFYNFIYGVQRLASSTISLNRWKTWKAVFLCSFLLLDAEQPFHNLIHGVQRPTPWNKSEFFKTWEAVSKNPFLLSAELNGLFTTLLSVFKELTFGNKSKNLKTWKAVSRFYFLLLRSKRSFHNLISK